MEKVADLDSTFKITHTVVYHVAERLRLRFQLPRDGTTELVSAQISLRRQNLPHTRINMLISIYPDLTSCVHSLSIRGFESEGDGTPFLIFVFLADVSCILLKAESRFKGKGSRKGNVPSFQHQ